MLPASATSVGTISNAIRGVRTGGHPQGCAVGEGRAHGGRARLDAVWVSNHGGRAFDGVQATITVLPRIAQAVEGRVRSSSTRVCGRADHVFKALALGANVVGCGRPVMSGLALGGAQGVQSVLEHIRDHLRVVMRLAGTPNIKSITRDYLAPPATA